MLVALLIFGAGLAVGQRGGGDHQGGEPHNPGTTAARPDPGPTRVMNGVPLGYARTEAGALAAATEFLKVGGGPLVADHDAYLEAMATMAAPEWEVNAGETARNAVSFVADRYGRDATSLTVPVSHKVISFTPDTASIEIYSVMLASGAELRRGEQIWGLSRVQLRWVDDDWRLSSEDNSSAPAPAFLSGQPEGDIAPILEGFDPYG